MAIIYNDDSSEGLGNGLPLLGSEKVIVQKETSLGSGVFEDVEISITDIIVQSKKREYSQISATTYTIALTDDILGIDCSSNAVTLTLPSLASLGTDHYAFIIKHEAGNARTNNITIAAAVGDTIQGDTSILIETASPRFAFFLYNSDTQWEIGLDKTRR